MRRAVVAVLLLLFLTAQTGNYGQASACGTFTTAEYAP